MQERDNNKFAMRTEGLVISITQMRELEIEIQNTLLRALANAVNTKSATRAWQWFSLRTFGLQDGRGWSGQYIIGWRNVRDKEWTSCVTSRTHLDLCGSWENVHATPEVPHVCLTFQDEFVDGEKSLFSSPSSLGSFTGLDRPHFVSSLLYFIFLFSLFLWHKQTKVWRSWYLEFLQPFKLVFTETALSKVDHPTIRFYKHLR